MRPRIGVTSIAIALALCAAGCGSSNKSATGSKPQSKGTPPVLFVQAAPHGAFEPVGGAKDRFTLTLRGLAPQVIWFSDRPARHFGHIPIERFVAVWKRFGFGTDPPNAALTLLRADDKFDTVIVKLGAPRYDQSSKTLRFPAQTLPHATGNLSDFEPDNDGAVPRSFADASLFIDDANGRLVEGCCEV